MLEAKRASSRKSATTCGGGYFRAILLGVIIHMSSMLGNYHRPSGCNEEILITQLSDLQLLLYNIPRILSAIALMHGDVFPTLIALSILTTSLLDPNIYKGLRASKSLTAPSFKCIKAFRILWNSFALDPNYRHKYYGCQYSKKVVISQVSSYIFHIISEYILLFYFTSSSYSLF